MSNSFIDAGAYLYTMFHFSLTLFEQQMTLINVFPIFNYKILMIN